MNRLPIKHFVSALISVLAVLVTYGPVFASDDSYSFGVVPQQSASRLANMWVPALKYWSKASGVNLVFTTAKDIPTFEACLAAGAYDFAYMNPYHYTVFHNISGYEAFGRQMDKKLKGILVVKKDSGHDSLSSLDGSEIAFPSPAAFGASVIPRAELSAGSVSFDPIYVKSHDSVYRAVAAGLFEAGGGVMRTFRTIDPEIRAQLSILYQTEGYTPHAFAAHGNVPSEIVERVKQVMTDGSIDNGTLSVLGFTGVQVADNADWDDVRSLNLASSHTEIIDHESLSCHSD